MNAKQTAKIVDYVENFYGTEGCGVWNECKGQNTAELYGMSDLYSCEITDDRVVFYAYCTFDDFFLIEERAKDYGIEKEDYIFSFLGIEDGEHATDGVVRFFVA